MNRLTVLLPLAILLAAGCGKSGIDRSSASVASPLPAFKVQLALVHAANVATSTEITGLIRPRQHAQLAAKVMGTIEEMPITLGQAVHTGDVLVKISAGEISARVVQAQSQLSSARRDLDRERDLLTKGASTADMVRGLEDRFTAAQAMVREAETMLAYTQIRAPFDGVIARQLANAGDLASPGFPLLEIEGASDFQVEVGIPESLAAALKTGAEVPVEVPTAGLHFAGPITEISSAADALALTVLAKIAVPADVAVRSGQFARVQIPGAPAPMVFVPTTAVSRIGQMQRVFVAGADNHAVLRLVKTGLQRGGQIEVTSGLDENDRVIIAPPAALREGQPLEVGQ